MHHRFIVGLVGAGCLLAACTTEKPAHPAAELVAANAPTAPTNQATDPNQMICKSVETTGSRLSQKECHTAGQWAWIKKHGLDDLQLESERHMSGDKGN